MADGRFDPRNIDPEDLEQIGREAEQTMHRLSKIEDELGAVKGMGIGADGLITAMADGGGRVVEISVNPRAMRLDSHVIADEIMKAVRSAQEEAERGTRELLTTALGGRHLEEMFDPAQVNAFLAASDESFAELMNEQMRRLRAPARE